MGQYNDLGVWKWLEELQNSKVVETIDLKEMEPGVFRKAQPYEDIRHPDYYEALKAWRKLKANHSRD